LRADCFGGCGAARTASGVEKIKDPIRSEVIIMRVSFMVIIPF